MLSSELRVNHQEFNYIMECTRLHPSEFLTRIYNRWGRLRELPPGTKVTITIEP